MSGYFEAFDHAYKWADVKNTDTPFVFTDDLTSDKGYFKEENGSRDFVIAGGIMRAASPEKLSLTYLHRYDKNVRIRARVRFSDVNPPESVFGFMCRYTCLDAYVRCGVFIKSGLAFIDSREGADLHCDRCGTRDLALDADVWYSAEFTVDGDRASLKLDGKTVLKVEGLSQQTPGLAAIYAHRLTLEVSDIEVTYLSDQGVLWKDCVHSKLPDEAYREGGTVIEMADGSLTYYTHRGNATFTSKDGGRSWQRADETFLTGANGYPNILRLRNGRLIRIDGKNAGDEACYAAFLSDNDGKTWQEVGTVTSARFGSENAWGGNMNDKLTEMSDGRIFYPLNYAARSPIPKLHGSKVFGQIFYSDDGGKSWQSSDTGTWEIEGNENMPLFGESKILECADGTYRLYNSWNTYGCVVCSDSADGGRTWGRLQKMPELVCSCSSMQFCRDPYADNDTTYWMVLVYAPDSEVKETLMRSRLSLFRTEDGKSWSFYGDFWRWENNNRSCFSLSHLVDPFITVTKDYVIAGSGVSERLCREGEPGGSHHAQRQHIWSIPKANLKKTELKPVEG